MTGYIHSLQSLGTVDGPGVRAVIFSTGCPLRCIYCHNPDTWQLRDGTPTDSEELCDRVLRLYPYIKNGGVTFSGGEPCVQASFFTAVAKRLKDAGLHIALDTSGAVYNKEVDELLELCDLVLLDVKATGEEDYESHTGGSLCTTLDFLGHLKEKAIPVWVRHVVVPKLNDSEEKLLRLKKILRNYPNVERVELLPFRKLCLEKYERLGIPFPLRDTPEASAERIDELKALFTDCFTVN